MKSAIIIHGMPSKKRYFNPRSPAESNATWLPWIQRQLIVNGILAQTPEFPDPYCAVYKKWCSVFERFAVDKNTALIGWSGGAGFLVRWLSENKVKVGKVALVAPWLDPRRALKTKFFNFKIDPNVTKRTDGITIFVSKDDFSDIIKSVDQLKTQLKGKLVIKEFTNKGHFTSESMKTEKFPELRDAILKN